ncbi:TetR/AcrR family transcriptional regulator [Nocardioides sp. WS12]|uniref:TetR/AcrR family transcriptional regulator n=1 Tax=Nocardioides sp. WS12 TaxID=2486272 RepID=UPI0015FB54C3|nr:TetR/AcrR family transcriptional regulator [Nocardioides sp. WS12]
MPSATTSTDVDPDAPAGRLWQGQTPDAREADRRHRLVEAGLELVGTQGVAALTMRAACRDASVGPRYFYDLFATREELLEAVYDETVDRVREPILEAVVAVAEGGTTTAIKTAFETAVDVVEADPRLGRILFRESAADDTLRPRSQAAMPDFVLTVVAQVAPERAEALRGAAGGWTLIGLSAAIFSLFLAWSEGVRHTSREEFIDHCASLAADTLGLDVER